MNFWARGGGQSVLVSTLLVLGLLATVGWLLAARRDRQDVGAWRLAALLLLAGALVVPLSRGFITSRRDAAGGQVALPDGAEWLRYTLDGDNVRMLHLLPLEGGARRMPAVVILHGNEGPDVFVADPQAAAYVEGLRRRGAHVYIPRYAEAPLRFGDPFPQQEGAALAAVRAVGRATGGQVALCGFSRGGYLALAVASREPALVSRLVVLYAGPPPKFQPSELPPLLILHGDADLSVPVDVAHTLHGQVQKAGREVELVLYPKEGHGFLGDALRDAVARVGAFLEQAPPAAGSP